MNDLLRTTTTLLALGALALLPGTAEDLPEIPIPPDDSGATIELRMRSQKDDAGRHGVRASFRLEDRLPESGIEFVHRIVDDAGKSHKAVHYDHGNGIAAADVDGDERIDLYFTTQLGRNELWRNLGNGRFEDITARAGVGVDDRISVAPSFADIDNDGDPDLYVTTVRQGNLLFENLGGGEFRDISEASGLGHVGHSSGVVWFDYDRDGLLDLFLTNVGRYTTEEKGPGGYFIGLEDAFSGHLHPDRAEASLLFENQGNRRFRDVTEARSLRDTSWSGDAIAADFDGNGWIDLYVLNMQGDDHLWLNREGERFEAATERYFPKTPWGAMGVVTLDHDNDGRFDLYLTDMHSDMSKAEKFPGELEKSDIQWSDEHLQGGGDNVFGNALYHQEPDPPWTERSDSLGAEVYWPWGVSAGDVNADGFEDLFVTASMNFPYRYQPNALLLNDSGERFVDVAYLVGVEPRRGGATRTPWFVVDCSGAEKDHPPCKDREGRYVITAPLGSRSSVFLDLEGDGDLDLVTNEFHSAPQVLVNDLADRDGIAHVEVSLVGTRSNRDGFGARVTVESDRGRQVRVHNGKSGYLAQSTMPLYFGLDGATKVERIVVEWPSGVRQEVPGPIGTGETVTVREPPAEAASGEPAEEGSADSGSSEG